MNKGSTEVINDIIKKLCSKNEENQDDIINISRGYKLLLNFMKSNILDGENLIVISNLIIKHLKKDNNEIIIVKVLECGNYLVDYLIDIENQQQQSEIVNELVQELLNERLIGNNGIVNNGVDDDEQDIKKEILENIQSVLSGIIKNFGFNESIQNHFIQSLIKSSNSNDHLFIENWLKIICNLLESSTLHSSQLSSLFRLIVQLLKYPNCQFYPSLYKVVTLIINDIGNQFLNEIDFNNQDSSIKKIILKLLEYDQEKKKKQHDQIDYINDSTNSMDTSSSSISSVNSQKNNNLPIKSKINNSNNNNSISSSNSSGINSMGSNNKIKSYKTLNSKSDEDDKFSKLSKRKPLGIQLLCENLNETEFEFRMNEIIQVLEDNESEWNIKLNNILKFQSLIKSGACKLSNFITLFNKIKELLIAQVLDKRSILMKEACLTVSSIAESLEHQFEFYFDKFFEALLKCIISTTKIVSESSDNCIKCIILSIKSCKIIPRLCDLIENDKSSIVRSKCAEYLLLLIQESSLNQLERYLEYIEKSIRIGIIDAQPTVRSISRQSYFQYISNWPSKSNKLFNSLDLNSQKIIQKEQDQAKLLIPSTSKSNSTKKLSNTPIITTNNNSNILPTNTAVISKSPFNNIKPSSNTEIFQIGKQPTVIKKSSLPSLLKKNNSPKPILPISFSSNNNNNNSNINKPLSSLPNFNLSSNPSVVLNSYSNNNIHQNPIVIKKKSPLKINNDSSIEKKRSITSVFTEASNLTTNSSRKKQMLTHPTSPTFKLYKNRFLKDSVNNNDDDDDFILNNNILKSLGSPKKIILDQQDNNHKLNSLGSPKRIIPSTNNNNHNFNNSSNNNISISPKKIKTTIISSSSNSNKPSPKRNLITALPIKTTSSITNNNKLLNNKPPITSSFPIKKNNTQIKNYVKDIITSQQNKSTKELKITDLNN